MEHLQIAVPVSTYLDIDKTVAFCQEKLGLDSVGLRDKNNAVIARDIIESHFCKCYHELHPKHTSCYIRVNDVERLYEEMKPVGAILPNGRLQVQPYKIREFAILGRWYYDKIRRKHFVCW